MLNCVSIIKSVNKQSNFQCSGKDKGNRKNNVTNLFMINSIQLMALQISTIPTPFWTNIWVQILCPSQHPPCIYTHKQHESTSSSYWKTIILELLELLLASSRSLDLEHVESDRLAQWSALTNDHDVSKLDIPASTKDYNHFTNMANV